MATSAKTTNNPAKIVGSSEPYQDEDLMKDFFVDFQEAHDLCTNVLIQLEKSPSDVVLLNKLFRSIHTIKGNLVYVGLKDVSPLLQSLEDILEKLRRKELQYNIALSDVILLALDSTKTLVESRINQTSSRFDSKLFALSCKAISRIANIAESKRAQAIRDAILLMDPSTELPPLHNQPEKGLPKKSTAKKRVQAVVTPKISQGKKRSQKRPSSIPAKTCEEILGIYGIEASGDMQFFINMAQPLETRSHYWQGRTERMLELALAMNDQANCPVDPLQLAAATIIHDLGMAFLPIDILHKASKLTAKEHKQVQTHPRLGFDLLRKMKHWEEAADIVLHHHERVDGGGYPKGLTALEISDGGKILAIVNTFDARTHERAHTALIKRPFIRALFEINKCAGSQFSQKWVDVFNQVIRKMPQYQHI